MNKKCDALFVEDLEDGSITAECANCSRQQVLFNSIIRVDDRVVLGTCISCEYILLYPEGASW